MTSETTNSSPLSKLSLSSPITTSSFDYLARTPLHESEKPYYFSGSLDPEQEEARHNLIYTTRANIPIRDLRAVEHQVKLKIHGFRLLKHRFSADLLDPGEEQLHGYLSEVSAFIKDQLEAKLVLCHGYRVSIVYIERIVL